jgi:hypothetical protein
MKNVPSTLGGTFVFTGSQLGFDRIPIGAPLIQPAAHTCDFFKACTEQNISALLAAVARAADYNHLTVAGDFAQAGRQLIQGNQCCVGHVIFVPLLLRADIQNEGAILIQAVGVADTDGARQGGVIPSAHLQDQENDQGDNRQKGDLRAWLAKRRGQKARAGASPIGGIAAMTMFSISSWHGTSLQG